MSYLGNASPSLSSGEYKLYTAASDVLISDYIQTSHNPIQRDFRTLDLYFQGNQITANGAFIIEIKGAGGNDLFIKEIVIDRDLVEDRAAYDLAILDGEPVHYICWNGDTPSYEISANIVNSGYEKPSFGLHYIHKSGEILASTFPGAISPGVQASVPLSFPPPSHEKVILEHFNTIKINASLIRGNQDSDLENNERAFSIYYTSKNPSAALPAIEGFENEQTWKPLAPTGSGWGIQQGHARINFFNTDTDDLGKPYRMISPRYDFSTGKRMLSFRIAYSLVTGNYSDTLRVYALKDCEKVLEASNILYKKGGDDLATINIDTELNPQNFADWRTEVVDLSALEGESDIHLVFVASNGLGNNIYVDDIIIQESVASTRLEEASMPQIVLDTQTALDAFTRHKISGIAGNLVIKQSTTNADKIQDISEINLKEILGSLIIEDIEASQLSAIFPYLENIGQDLIIRNNTSLSALDGFEGLRGIGGNLIVTGNTALEICCSTFGRVNLLTRGAPTFSNNKPGCSNGATLNDCQLLSFVNQNQSLSTNPGTTQVQIIANVPWQMKLPVESEWVTNLQFIPQKTDAQPINMTPEGELLAENSGHLVIEYDGNSMAYARASNFLCSGREGASNPPSSQTFTLTQRRPDPVLDLSGGNFGATEGGTKMVALSSNLNWQISNIPDWITLSYTQEGVTKTSSAGLLKGANTIDLDISYTAHSGLNSREITMMLDTLDETGTKLLQTEFASIPFIFTQLGAESELRSTALTPSILGAEQGVASFSLISNIMWQLTVSQEWIMQLSYTQQDGAVKNSVNGVLSGTGSQTITFNYLSNESTENRIAKVKLEAINVAQQIISTPSAFEFNIQQNFEYRTLSLGDFPALLEARTGEISIEIDANTTWHLELSADWIRELYYVPSDRAIQYSVNGVIEGQGSGEIIIKYTNNTGAKNRKTTMTIQSTNSSGELLDYIDPVNALIEQKGVPIKIIIGDNTPIAPIKKESTFTITSNIDWKIIPPIDAVWITEITPIRGKSSDAPTVVTVKHEKNIRSIERKAIFNIKNGTNNTPVTLIQEGVKLKIVNRPVHPLSAAGAVFMFTIETNTAWVITETSDWVTGLSSDNGKTFTDNLITGEGLAQITVRYESNIASTRGAELAIQSGALSEAIAFSQVGLTPELGLQAVDVDQLDETAGSFIVNILSNVPWELSIDEDWLTASTTQGENNRIVTISYTENSSAESRKSIITATQQGDNPIEPVNLTIEQRGTVLGTQVQASNVPSIQFTPNPVKDYLFVRGEESVLLTIRDVFGGILLRSALNGGGKINLSAYPPGVYLVSTKGETGTQTQRIIKQ